MWEGLRPELVVEIGVRPHHRQPNTPWREVHALARRQGSERVPYLAAAFLILLLLLPATPAAAQVQPEVTRRACATPTAGRSTARPATCTSATSAATNEEITFLPAAQSRGANLGWNCFSGTAVESGCTPSNYRPPSLPVPEQRGRGDRGLPRARPGAAVVPGPVPVRPLRYRDHHEARALRPRHRQRTRGSTSRTSRASERTAWATSTRPRWPAGSTGSARTPAARSPRPASETSTSPSPWPRPPATRTSCSSSRSQDASSCARPRGRTSSST